MCIILLHFQGISGLQNLAGRVSSDLGQDAKARGLQPPPTTALWGLMFQLPWAIEPVPSPLAGTGLALGYSARDTSSAVLDKDAVFPAPAAPQASRAPGGSKGLVPGKFSSWPCTSL